jgi:hypothetical protein
MVSKGTTPEFTINLSSSISKVGKLYVTIAQGYSEITETYDTSFDVSYEKLSDTQIYVVLTQEETLRLKEGMAYMQVKAINSTGNVVCTDIYSFNVMHSLKDEVIAYE